MAFTELYELMAERLFRFAHRMLRDRGAAEDAVQHSFLELVRAQPRLASDRSLEAWMFKSIRFTCLDEIRRRTRRPEVPSDRLPEHGEEDALMLLIDPDLERALATLTPEQQEVLHLKHVEGYDGEEIAEIVDSNRTAVYAMAARAEARLKKLLDPVESSPGPASSTKRPT
jgi:RNA polymerase sigma-70 factor (ECF subfamily)